MKQLKKQVLLVILPMLTLAASGQLSLQSYTTSLGGGRISGDGYTGEIAVGASSGISSSNGLSSYIGLVAANLKTAIITVRAEDGSENLIDNNVNGYLLKVTESGSYDTLEIKQDVVSEFPFSPVFTGRYLVNISGDPETYIPTYNGNVILWEEAEQIALRKDSSISIDIESVPMELTPTENGGVISGTIETELTSPPGRALQTGPDVGRSCGLRTNQDGNLELIAITETDENGFFEFTNLPASTYEFFIDVPGVPFNEAASTTINLVEGQGSTSEFQVQAVITENGIDVEIEEVLGFLENKNSPFRVYPNPASDQLVFSLLEGQREKLRVEMRDVNGKLIFHDLLRVNSITRKIQVSDLTRGLYFIKISSPSGSDQAIYKVVLK